MERVYFDYNATTPLAPEVASAMRPFLEEEYGNPSSLHWAGQRARAAIEHARSQVATLLRCEPAEIVFTSGGTEANNSALAGVFFKSQRKDAAAFYYQQRRASVDFERGELPGAVGRRGNASPCRSIRPGRS